MTENIGLCPVCGVNFHVNHGNRKYCSPKCSQKRRDQKYFNTPKGRAKRYNGTNRWKLRNKEKVSRYNISHLREYRKKFKGFHLSPPCVIGPELTVESDNVLVTSDWHIPFVREDTFSMFLGVAEEEGVRDLAIVGDFWDNDAISTYNNSKHVCFDEEIRYVRYYLEVLMDFFDRIWICSGNHEHRWSKWNKGKLDTIHLYRETGLQLDEDKITTRDYLLLNDDWRLCHSKNYSRRPCKVAKELALKYERNILNSHGHFCEAEKVYVNPYRREEWFHAIDLGGLFDLEAIPYMLSSSNYPLLENGFCLVQDGEPVLFRMKDFR